jgi:hypothetical protein
LAAKYQSGGVIASLRSALLPRKKRGADMVFWPEWALKRFCEGDWSSHMPPGQGVMKSIASLTLFFAILAGGARAGELVRVEPASAGRPYDFIVHVQNTYAIGYNPEVREDRNRMALRILRGQCRSAWVVGDDKIDTEIFGITTSRPDYIVLVKCA